MSLVILAIMGILVNSGELANGLGSMAGNSVFLARNPRFTVFLAPKCVNRRFSGTATKVRKLRQTCKNLRSLRKNVIN